MLVLLSRCRLAAIDWHVYVKNATRLSVLVARIGCGTIISSLARLSLRSSLFSLYCAVACQKTFTRSSFTSFPRGCALHFISSHVTKKVSPRFLGSRSHIGESPGSLLGLRGALEHGFRVSGHLRRGCCIGNCWQSGDGCGELFGVGLDELLAGAQSRIGTGTSKKRGFSVSQKSLGIRLSNVSATDSIFFVRHASTFDICGSSNVSQEIRAFIVLETRSLISIKGLKSSGSKSLEKV